MVPDGSPERVEPILPEKVEVAPTPDLWGGDDDEITSPDQDAFERSAFARHLAQVIRAAPAESSFRIGLFAEWGEGKTSVMSLMQHYLPEREFVCVRVSVWDVRDARDIVRRVASALSGAAGTDRGVSAGARALVGGVGRGLSDLRKAADAHWVAKGLDAVFGDAVEAGAQRVAEATVREQLNRTREALGDKRAVVFVDDLDRADASSLPRVLMALREAVPIEGLVFVLALSAQAVQQALEKSKYGLETAERFLEKIIEYPTYLPPIPRHALQQYASSRIAAIEGLRRPEVLQDLAPHLPRNPRRLKLYLRTLAALRPTLERFDDGEVNWLALYLAQLLLSEFPLEARRLRDDLATLKDMELSWIREVAGGETDKQRHEERYAPEGDTDRRERFMELCGLFRAQQSLISRYRLVDLMQLDSAPPCLTRREAVNIIEEINRSGQAEWPRIVMAAVRREGATSVAAFSHLWQYVIDFRDGSLGESYRSLEPSRQKETEAAVNRLTELLEVMVIDMQVFQREQLGASAWLKLLSHFGTWANAREGRGQEQMRDREIALLLRSLEQAPMVMLEGIRQGVEDQLEIPDKYQRPPAFVSAIHRLNDFIRTQAADDVLDRFTRPQGVSVLTYGEWNENGKWLVFDRNSLLYSEAYLKRLGALADMAAKGDSAIQGNFLTLLQLLDRAARGHSAAVPSSEATAILTNAPFTSVLWRGATASLLTESAAHSLSDIRSAILKAGGPNDVDLPIPDWWPTALKSDGSVATSGETS